MSSSGMEFMAAAVLSDDSDHTRLSWEEVERSWGSWESFMISYGLKPYNQEDCKEALAISRGCKQCQDEDESSSNQASGGATKAAYKDLPKIGKWIKWNHGEEFKGQVLGYEDNYAFYCHNPEKTVNIKHIDGTEDSLCQKELVKYNWSYCEAPSKQEIEKAVYEDLNLFIGDRSCNTCECNSKKLQLCTGCYKVYYCDATCQRADWTSHKNDCKREKIVLRPNPRYPLSEVSNKVKEDQIKTQEKHHQILQDAMAGNFTVEVLDSDESFVDDNDDNALVDENIVTNPKAGTDLESYRMYRLKTSNEANVFTFEWEGLETSQHSIPEGKPTSCTLLGYMRNFLAREESMNSGLHYLAGDSSGSFSSEIFWFMIINFNTFGTVAPFHGPCQCSPNNVKAQMPPEWRELRKKWNKIFKRAKDDINDVQCMFSNSDEGCHNYSNCPYKHDIEVKKEKKKRAQ